MTRPPVEVVQVDPDGDHHRQSHPGRAGSSCVGSAAGEHLVDEGQSEEGHSGVEDAIPDLVGVADAAVGERVWSVDELIAALVQGPEHGVLLSGPGADDPVRCTW